MTDLHAHILPGMDDGSRDAEETAEMLAASAAQGIACIAATPHFYAEENSIGDFLRRREAAAERLQEIWQPGFPQLRYGAEVYFFDGMSHVAGLKQLRITGTELLLLEMPFRHWTERVAAEAAALQMQPGVTVVLAHIERYLPYRNAEWLEELRDAGVRMQSNAEFFLHWRTRRKALRMLRRGEIDVLGSDCHNMGARPPCLGKALAAMAPEDRRQLECTLQQLLPAEAPEEAAGADEALEVG